MNFFISADLFLYAIYVYRRLFDYLPMTIFVCSDAVDKIFLTQRSKHQYTLLVYPDIYTDIYTDIVRHFSLLLDCLENAFEHKDDKVCAVPCGIPQGYSPAIFSAIVFIATNR